MITVYQSCFFLGASHRPLIPPPPWRYHLLVLSSFLYKPFPYLFFLTLTRFLKPACLGHMSQLLLRFSVCALAVLSCAQSEQESLVCVCVCVCTRTRARNSAQGNHTSFPPDPRDQLAVSGPRGLYDQERGAHTYRTHPPPYLEERRGRLCSRTAAPLR